MFGLSCLFIFLDCYVFFVKFLVRGEGFEFLVGCFIMVFKIVVFNYLVNFFDLVGVLFVLSVRGSIWVVFKFVNGCVCV